MSGSDGTTRRDVTPAQLVAALEEAQGPPIGRAEAARRLAAELGMPDGATPMHAPAEIKDGWRAELFGEVVTDGPPMHEPAPMDGNVPWVGYQVGRAGVPVLSILAWQIIIRRDGIAPFIEARRDGSGRWEVAIRGLGSNPTHKLVRQILPGLGLIRRQITRAGGRPPGRTKRSDEAICKAVAKYKRSTATSTPPPAKWLAGELKVSQRTAEGYLRRVKFGK